MPHLSTMAFILVGTAPPAPTSVERWGQWELELDGPPTGNPFMDVQIEAAFSMSSSNQQQQPPPNQLMQFSSEPASTTSSTPPPQALVALDFTLDDVHTSRVVNSGTSGKDMPSGVIINCSLSKEVPPGSPSSSYSLDLGADVVTRHVVEIPADKQPFHGGLAGLAAFTITGWINVRDAAMGAGGDRVLNYCSGGGGIDLVWDADSAALKLSVNEWPDNAHPQSSDGSVPAGATPIHSNWVFFAVTYAAEDVAGNVKWYFGASDTAALLDTNSPTARTIYNKGKVNDPNLPLAFGNFGSGYHANDRMLRGMLFQPRVFSSALSLAEIVAVQDRSGCAPACNGSTCGSDGCGGTCGACTGAKVCNNMNGPGTPKVCDMPTTGIIAGGFYDGNGKFKVRFAPPYEGKWTYTTKSNIPALNGKTGAFQATAPSTGSHGPVQSEGFSLIYADGTPYFSVGTTCYQWSSKDFGMQAQTLQTLKVGQGHGPIFNKLRMTVFPKWYEYNSANPVQTGTAYEIIPGSVASNATVWECDSSDCPPTAGSFDLTRFNVSYWQNYERLLGTMQELGVVADIIVFHPYDRGHWGFDCMGGTDPAHYNTTNDEFYLKYLAARISSFSNVWWSMANEWNFCQCKSGGATVDNGPTPVWDALFKTLSSADPYGRQMSIHNGALLYNHSQPWITHVSLQGHESDTPQLRSTYGKPTIWDEVEYEGDIPSQWGALSGEEETDRFWLGASLGVHVGHSETILRPDVRIADQPLWWAKGGQLVGSSPPRIKWFRELFQTNVTDFGSLLPTQESFGNSQGNVANMLSNPGKFHFVHFNRPGTWTIPLQRCCPGGGVVGGCWKVELLDYWEMSQTTLATLPVTAINATVDVPTIPCNVMITCLDQL